MSSGQSEMTGASSSTTVTSYEHVATFPAASVAVNSKVVTPRGSSLPGAGPEVWTMTGSSSQLSSAVGKVKLYTAWHSPSSVLSVRSSGQSNTGAVSSTTSTVKEHWVVLPDSSVAS